MRIQPGERVLVMGLAKSGEAVARLLQNHGMTVVVNDYRDRLENDSEAEALEASGMEVVLGGHPLSLLEPKPRFIVKNPGIRYTVPLVQTAEQLGIPIYTEIEVASWLTKSPIYAITGSNGKTTTTTLVGEILVEAGRSPMVAGNIGRVLSGVVEQVAPTEPIVLEVSSFQLLGTEDFHPQIGALLNLYPSHLDYHETFDSYAAAKMKLFANMNADDIAVLNYDSEPIQRLATDIRAKIVWFSRLSTGIEGASVEDGWVVFRQGGQVERVMAVESILLKGDHQLENVLAATAITMSAGVAATAISAVAARFQGVEHRLEFVRRLGNVDYFNDSKATNSQAALHALQSLPGRIVWIAGGLDRGDDFSLLADEIQNRVKHAVLLGQSSPKLASLCERLGISYQRVDTIQAAVIAAEQAARDNDTVLLSPACASWDMFASFEERGRMFKESVHRL